MGTEHQQGLTGSGAFALDPTSPFEASIIEIVKMQRAKTRDYAEDGSMFSNFEGTAWLTDQAPEESALFNVAQKLVRLRSLKANGRTSDPTNESVQDTYLDLAVYACIAYALVQQSARAVAAEEPETMLNPEEHPVTRGGLITGPSAEPSYPYTMNRTPGSVTTTITGAAREGVDWRDLTWQLRLDPGKARYRPDLLNRDNDDDDGDAASVGATA